jgi:magnesium transporter
VLVRGDQKIFSDPVRMYLRDSYDHCVQLAGTSILSYSLYLHPSFSGMTHGIEIVDSYRELSNGLINTYMSAVGLRTNEIMKFLTIIGMFLWLLFGNRLSMNMCIYNV